MASLKSAAVLCSFALFFLSSFFFAQANDGDVCLITSPPIQDPQQGTTYDITLKSPVSVSTDDTGQKNSGCGVATFSASGLASNALDANGAKVSKTNMVAQCAAGVKLSASNGGTFDEHTNTLVALLNKDPLNCYRITIKRINQFTDPPVTNLPAPTKQTIDNVEIVTYRPYTFNAQDIVLMMNTLNKNQNGGGIGLGGVFYDSKNRPVAAHMFQPRAIDSASSNTPNGPQQDIRVYDPYFGKDVDLKLAWDNQKRMYIDLWEGANLGWANLEELFSVENLGPAFCAARNKGGVNVVNPKPATPKNPASGAVVLGPITPRPSTNVQCGNGKIEPPDEECDDGNTANNDGCSSTCKREFCGDNIIQTDPNRQEECDPPLQAASQCPKVGSMSGFCMADCMCLSIAPA